MQGDAEDEYFLGGGRSDDEDVDDRRADDRRTRRGALVGLAVVVVVVALAITLTAVLVDTSSAARGPRSTALRWGRAVLHGDATARRRLECANGSDEADAVRSTLADATGVSTGGAHRIGHDRWSVPLEIDGADGSLQDSVDVTVVREAGRYLVC